MVKTSDFESENSGSSPDAAATDEIEITPEMIKAGADVYYAMNYRVPSNIEDVLPAVFEAMWSARRTETHPSGGSTTQ